METPVPTVEVTNDTNPRGVGSPHHEADAADAFVLDRVRAKRGIQALEAFCGMLRLMQPPQVRIRKNGRKAVGIVGHIVPAIREGDDQQVREELGLTGKDGFEDAFGMNALHGEQCRLRAFRREERIRLHLRAEAGQQIHDFELRWM